MVGMTPRLQKPFDQLQAQTEKLLAQLAGWSPEQLRHRPNPAAWCAAEVLDHLARTDRGIFATMRRTVNSDVTNPVTTKDRLTTAMVLAAMRSTARTKVPPAASLVLPDPTCDPAAAIAELLATHTELGTFLDQLPSAQLANGVFRHPVGGWMNPARTVTFLAVHMRHHRYQIDRIQGSAPQLAT